MRRKRNGASKFLGQIHVYAIGKRECDAILTTMPLKKRSIPSQLKGIKCTRCAIVVYAMINYDYMVFTNFFDVGIWTTCSTWLRRN